MRRSTLLWAILGISVVVGLFVVKHRVQDLEDRLHALNAEIITDRDAIQVMEAEWSYLNQPARLETLSKRLLGMEAPASTQTISMQELLQQTTPEVTEQVVATGTVKPSQPAKKPAAKRAPPAKDDDWLTPILVKLKNGQ